MVQINEIKTGCEKKYTSDLPTKGVDKLEEEVLHYCVTTQVSFATLTAPAAAHS